MTPRKPLPRKRATKRRTTSPCCKTRSCNGRAEIQGMCIRHAEALADKLFSRWVRDRDGRCTAAACLPKVECKGILQAAHVNGRRKYSVRFDPQNVHTLCAAHHYLVDQHGHEAEKQWWAIAVLGDEDYDCLMGKALEITKRRTAIEAALAWLTGGDTE